MKKAIKIGIVLLILSVMCMSLCSCQALDDMRNNQAFWTDTSKEEITYNGTNYKYIPVSLTTELYPCDVYDSQLYLYITEKDVPVLLSSTGDNATISYDKNIITRYSESGASNVYYVEESMYDEVIDDIKNNKFDNYCVYQYVQTELQDHSYDYSFEYRMLNEEEQKAVEDVLENVKPVIIEDYSYSLYSYGADIQKCDKNGLFCRQPFDSITLYQRQNGEYCICIESYPSDTSEDLPDTKRYDIPEKYEKLFKRMYQNADNPDYF